MPGAIAKIARNFQVTVPKYVRQAMHVKVGDIVSFEIAEDGQILLTPVTMVKKEHSYWTPKWKREIKKSEEQKKKGQFNRNKSVEELNEHLGDL